MSISEYGDLDGIALAQLVAKGEVTALELVEEAITRVEPNFLARTQGISRTSRKYWRRRL